MLFRKNIVRTFLIFAAVILCSLTFCHLTASAETSSLYLGGFPAGFTLNTTTVAVIGICDVITKDGMRSPARESGIKTGDIIEKINNQFTKKKITTTTACITCKQNDEALEKVKKQQMVKLAIIIGLIIGVLLDIGVIILLIIRLKRYEI